ncbi:hypothetical protein EJ110_NYTH25384, partial [Nymphaea thermarum]
GWARSRLGFRVSGPGPSPSFRHRVGPKPKKGIFNGHGFKVLIIGSTGDIGAWITKACLASSRHQIFLLTGATTHASIHKLPLLLSYKQAGATLVEASLDDHESLLSLLSGIDYVISAIAENQIEQQLKLVQAIKQVRTIKRFLPSEYVVDPDFMEDSIVPGSVLFEQKRRVRRAVEESGIPHTYVVAHCFAGYFLSGLANFGRFWPPAAKVQIYGDGNHKVVWMAEEDIGKYVVKAMDDVCTLNRTIYVRPPSNIKWRLSTCGKLLAGRPCRRNISPSGNGFKRYKEDIGKYVVKAMDDVRTLNRTIYVRPPSNIKSQMEVVNLWEALSGMTRKKDHITEQQWLQKIQGKDLESGRKVTLL